MIKSSHCSHDHQFSSRPPSYLKTPDYQQAIFPCVMASFFVWQSGVLLSIFETHFSCYVIKIQKKKVFPSAKCSNGINKLFLLCFLISIVNVQPKHQFKYSRSLENLTGLYHTSPLFVIECHSICFQLRIVLPYYIHVKLCIIQTTLFSCLEKLFFQ